MEDGQMLSLDHCFLYPLIKGMEPPWMQVLSQKNCLKFWVKCSFCIFSFHYQSTVGIVIGKAAVVFFFISQIFSEIVVSK